MTEGIAFPETETVSLDDGCVQVKVGDQSGVVSSFHLVEPKVNQLRTAWLRERGDLT
jgi:hypothetical protein